MIFTEEDIEDFINNHCNHGLADDWYVNEADAAKLIFDKFSVYMSEKTVDSNLYRTRAVHIITYEEIDEAFRHKQPITDFVDTSAFGAWLAEKRKQKIQINLLVTVQYNDD